MSPRRSPSSRSPRGRSPRSPGSPRDIRIADTEPVDVPCVCPMPNCVTKSSSIDAFYEHLAGGAGHALTSQDLVAQLLRYFASIFFLLDTSYDRTEFSAVCSLCKKGSNSPSQPVQTSVAEDEQHIHEHWSVPELYCTICEVFIKQVELEEHCLSGHNTKSDFGRFIKTGPEFFAGTTNRLAIYNGFVKKLITGRDKDLQTTRARTRPEFERTNKVREDLQSKVVKAVLKEEHTISSLATLSGHYVEIFKAIGNLDFIAKLILAVPLNEVIKCCEEVVLHFEEFFFHPVAGSALVNLLTRCSTEHWNAFTAMVLKNKDKIAASHHAANVIRRIMAVAPTSSARKEALANAIFPGDQIDNLTIEGTYASYIMQGICDEDNSGARKIAVYFSTRVSVFN